MSVLRHERDRGRGRLLHDDAANAEEVEKAMLEEGEVRLKVKAGYVCD